MFNSARLLSTWREMQHVNLRKGLVKASTTPLTAPS
jgi:hypothetical protein